MIKPKEITVTDIDGDPHTFTISRMPAVQGREVVAKYPMSALPKLGDYAVNEEVMLKLMSFVAVKNPGAEGGLLPLTTRALVDSHCGDWECLAKVERAMLEYNTSFFSNGVISRSLSEFAPKVKAWILSTLTDLSAVSSPPGGPRSTN